MDRTGAIPPAGDLSCLTVRQREIYEWAVSEVSAVRDPHSVAIAAHFGIANQTAGEHRRIISTKVGWPCRVRSWSRRTNVLTPVQEKALRFARSEAEAGRYVGCVRLAGHLGCNPGNAQLVIVEVRRKVGWPGRAPTVPFGVHRLTVRRREIVTTAWSLWESEPREYPSTRVLHRLLGDRMTLRTIEKARSYCVSRGLWPCRVRPYRRSTPEERDFIVSLRRQGLEYGQIADRFRQEFGRRISESPILRHLRAAGLVKSHRYPVPSSLEQRRDLVLAERNGIARPVEEPSGVRRRSRIPASF